MLKSNIFWGLLSAAIAVLLTFVSIHFSNESREPVYAIKKNPSIIFDSQNASSKIRITTKDSLIIDSNIYVSSIVIWNNGELEIEKTDIRKDFVIKVDSGKILDYKIIQETHPKISKFKIIPQSENLLLDWDYFDPGFGLELQITYSGTNKSKISADGYVLNAELKEVVPKGKVRSPIIQFGFIAIIFLSVFGGSWLIGKFTKKIKNRILRLITSLSLIVIIIIVVIFLLSKLSEWLEFDGVNLPL